MKMTKTSTDAQIVGSVSFINGDALQFTDSKEYLDCIREELPYRATSGFSFRTVTQDPAIRKAVDDIVYDFYGEENPCREEYYNLALSEEM
jgi:16S rRNA A1518/A1519 N6-dimethyltransferase RsmA/KsgA/DIM1 with predicted DNA glycosylase/AP lyase activity